MFDIVIRDLEQYAIQLVLVPSNHVYLCEGILLNEHIIYSPHLIPAFSISLGDSIPPWERVFRTKEAQILDKEDYCNRVAEQYALYFGADSKNVIVAAEDASINGVRVEVTAMLEVGVSAVTSTLRSISAQLLRSKFFE